MPTTEFFIKEFRDVDTEELLRRAVTRDLTDEASAAMAAVLKERGITGDELPGRLHQAKKDVFRESGITNQCDFCGKNLFGRLVDGGQKFCDRECLVNARALEASLEFSQEEVLRHAGDLRSGTCPVCRRNRPPVELHQEYTIVSGLIAHSTSRRPFLSCRPCNKSTAIKAIAFCSLLGWWSVKGFFLTFQKIFLNIQNMRSVDGATPSPGLIEYARLDLGKIAIGAK